MIIRVLPDVGIGLHVLQSIGDGVVAVGRLTSAELAQETLLVVLSEPVGECKECRVANRTNLTGAGCATVIGI